MSTIQDITGFYYLSIPTNNYVCNCKLLNKTFILGPFTNRGPDANEKSLQIFGGHFQTSKNVRAPFFHENYGVNAIENHVNSIFLGKFVAISFQGFPSNGR